jgi:predicted transcriptional regulator
MARAYKDFKIYGCFTLNRLVSELGIDLYQEGLEEKLDRILTPERLGLSKEEIKHEIMSNHFMTNKVLESLHDEGFIQMEQREGRYEVNITKAGVLYIRKYNEFFFKLYEDQIVQHYRFRGLPQWARGMTKE